jgi:hypothetical protein
LSSATPAASDSRAATEPSFGRSVVSFIFWAVVFGVSYTQAQLFYSNQNQYFLHGRAAAGFGYLDKDWLANTADPVPVFSTLVGFTFDFFDPRMFYVYYFLIFGCYVYSLLGIFTFLTGGKTGRVGRLCFAAFLVFIHAGIVRLASAQLLDVDYPWYFQAGVAGQYVLGFGLQPSTCGVLLLVSIYTFLRGCPWWAQTLACLAAVLHSTYLLAAAFLTLAYMCLWFQQGRRRQALVSGLWALLLVGPTLAYNLVMFAPTNTEDFTAAQAIIAHFRIPHHAEPERWFDGVALGQVAWIVVAMVLVRRTHLFWIMLIPTILALVLTGVQVLTANDTLALLFPWRISVILVPVATAVILSWLVNDLEPWFARRTSTQRMYVGLSCTAVLALLMAGGVAISLFGWGYRTNPDEMPVLEYIRDHKGPGEQYLLPVSLPKLKGGPRGAASTNFMPAPRAGKSGHLIAIDMQQFRLVTGAPLYVDFKSIPYQDAEVLEWQRRLKWANAVYDGNWNRDGLRKELATEGITHVVATTDIDSKYLERIYPNATFADATYRVYRVRKQ